MGGGEVVKESVGLDALAEPTTEGEPLANTRPEGTEILLLLTLADSEGIDVDSFFTGGTGVALGDLAGTFLIVALPLAFEEALGFEVMVDLKEQESAFAGRQNLNKVAIRLSRYKIVVIQVL